MKKGLISLYQTYASYMVEMTGVSVFFLAAFESKRLLRKIPTSSTFYEFVYEFWFPDCEF